MTDAPPRDDGALEVVVAQEAAPWSEQVPDAEALVARAARAAFASAGAPAGPAELSVVLADDALVRRLNRDYRGKDKPTNVLSFPQIEGDEALESGAGVPILLGDVVLAFETVAGEARAQGKSLADHLAHLVVHGVLHLLGYDHETEPEAERMERLETRLLADMGIADPYAAERRGDGRPSPSQTEGR